MRKSCFVRFGSVHSGLACDGDYLFYDETSTFEFDLKLKRRKSFEVRNEMDDCFSSLLKMKDVCWSPFSSPVQQKMGII